MSYTALGASYNISTPWGTKSINVPMEQVAQDAANVAVNHIIPPAIDAAMARAIPAFEAELPSLMQQASQEVQPELRKEINRALEIGTSRGVAIGTGIAIVMIATSWLTWRKLKRK